MDAVPILESISQIVYEGEVMFILKQFLAPFSVLILLQPQK